MGLRAEEFVWDSFSDGQDARGPAALQQGFQFVELGQFLTDGVRAFCVVGVVEGQFTGREPSVGAGVVGSG